MSKSIQANLKQGNVFVPELFDALSDSVIWFVPVFEEEEITDFEVAYCNHAATVFLKTRKEVLQGQRLLQPNAADEQKQTAFKQFLQVWTTGTTQEENFHSPYLNRSFSVVKNKVLGGVISVSRDNTGQFNSEKFRLEQAKRFEHILDASADGVMLLEALRNAENKVIDFRIAHCNKAGLQLARLSPNNIGRTLLEALPHLKDSEQFDMHIQVLETGNPIRIESTFRDEHGNEYGWFICTLMKLDDNIVSSFVDILENKENKEKIEEQAGLLTSIFETSANAIVACEAIRDKNGQISDLRILKINEGFSRYSGKKAYEAEGSTYLTLYPAAKKHPFYNAYCEVIETGKSLRSELHYPGEEMQGWFDVSAVKLGDNGIVITFIEITENKLYKEALEEAGETLQQVIDNSQTGIILLTPVRDAFEQPVDFRIKTINQTFANYTGKPASELAGKLFSKVFPDNDAIGLFTRYKNIFSAAQTEQRFQNNFKYGDINVWFDVSVKKLEDNLLITLLDYTPLRKLQSEIESAAAKLNTVINTSHAGIFTITPVVNSTGQIEDFRFGIVNEAVSYYINHPASDLSGNLCSIYFPAYKTNGLFEIYVDCYLNNKENLFDFHYRGTIDLYFNIHTVKSGDELLVTFADHTHLKRLQLQLEASVNQLKNSNANLEEFAYAASHDLQEPLRKIHYFSERLKKVTGERLTIEEKGMFERMENAAKRMTRLIDDLLLYSQIDAKKEVFKQVRLTDILHEVLADLEPLITEKNAVVHVGSLPVITGDARQLNQLFLNLLSNSLKYCRQNISPVISIESETVVKSIEGETKAYYRISITDNGIGFDQDNAEQIFKVFHRLHGQRDFPGTGIGLAIVYKVVKSHYGFISAEGAPDKGAVFSMLLPIE